MFCFIVLPFSASQFFHGKWIHGDILCTIIPVLRYGCVGVSLLSIAMISINRYILIAWPHLYADIYTKTNVFISIAVIWIFSYGLQIPTLMGQWGVFGLDEKLGTCSINKDSNGNSSKTAMFVIGFALPCVIIIICYANIFWVVRKSHERLKQHNSRVDYKKSEMKITKMVLVIFVCFVVCYLPITIVKIFDTDVEHAPLHIFSYILIYTSSCVNPVVYVTMNKQYRQAYMDTLRCRYSSANDSQHTVTPHSRTHLSVGYLKNVVNQSPKV